MKFTGKLLHDLYFNAGLKWEQHLSGQRIWIDFADRLNQYVAKVQQVQDEQVDSFQGLPVESLSS